MSNFAPLWTGSYRQSKEEISKKVLNYLAKSEVDDYIGKSKTKKFEIFMFLIAIIVFQSEPVLFFQKVSVGSNI